MDKETKSPLDLVTELLAVMTARAVEAERQRDEAQKSADEWYQNCLLYTSPSPRD